MSEELLIYEVEFNVLSAPYIHIHTITVKQIAPEIISYSRHTGNSGITSTFCLNNPRDMFYFFDIIDTALQAYQLKGYRIPRQYALTGFGLIENGFSLPDRSYFEEVFNSLTTTKGTKAKRGLIPVIL